jgi:hypothetical protein
MKTLDIWILNYFLMLSNRKTIRSNGNRPSIYEKSKQRRIICIQEINSKCILPCVYHEVQFSGLYFGNLEFWISSLIANTTMIEKQLPRINSQVPLRGSTSSLRGSASSLRGSLISLRSLGASLLNLPMVKSGQLQDVAERSSTDNIAEDDSSEELSIPYHMNISQFLLSQIESLLRVFAELNKYDSTACPKLSKYRLFVDIWCEIQHLFSLPPTKFVSEQVNYDDLIQNYAHVQMTIQELSDNLIPENINHVYIAKGLEAVCSVMEYASSDLWEASLHPTFFYINEHSKLDFFRLRLDVMSNNSIKKDLKSFLISDFDPKSVQDRKLTHLIQDHRPEEEKIWVIDICDERKSVDLNTLVDYSIQSPSPPSGSHLIIFVHGLLGNEYDLRTYRNQLVQMYQESRMDTSDLVFLFSKCNQGNTLGNLVTLGNNLAREIADFIRWEGLQVKNLSFVSHSLGGIIARLAIRNELLSEWRDRFHTFTCLASPLLSLLLHSHQVLGSALSILKTFYGAACVDQLYLQDHEDKRQCLLYQLSLDKNLGFFQRVNLIGSNQDLYVQFEGALAIPLLDYKSYTAFDSEKKQIYREMQRNFITNCQSLTRLELYFGKVLDGKVNGWVFSNDPLGREAHISLLTNKAALDLILYNLHAR